MREFAANAQRAMKPGPDVKEWTFGGSVMPFFILYWKPLIPAPTALNVPTDASQTLT